MAAGAQRHPVGPTGIGLVAGQVRHLGARPAPPTGPGYPYLVDQPDQVAGVSILTRAQPGHQVAATAVADRVQLGGQPIPRPPQRLLAACLDRRDPLYEPGSVLVGPHHAGVDLGIPVQLPCTVGLGAQGAWTLAQVPSVCQRANRLETVSQGPYRSGT
jgi:hypothetical protein